MKQLLVLAIVLSSISLNTYSANYNSSINIGGSQYDSNSANYSAISGSAGNINASASLSFNYGKKIGLTIQDPINNSLSLNPLFNNSRAPFNGSGCNSIYSMHCSGTVSHINYNDRIYSASFPNLSYQNFNIQGIAYSNTNNTFLTTRTEPEFVNLTNPSSRISIGYQLYELYNNNATALHWGHQIKATVTHPVGQAIAPILSITNIDTELRANNNSIPFNIQTFIWRPSVEASDRNGLYTNTLTIGITNL